MSISGGFSVCRKMKNKERSDYIHGFFKRREYLFLYSVKDANPNGDPLNANHPRFDAETSRIMVSDVRIKRTIRDQWLREGLPVFVDGEAKTLRTRIDELKEKLNASTGKEALGKCIDTKLFGVTFALGNESFLGRDRYSSSGVDLYIEQKPNWCRERQLLLLRTKVNKGLFVMNILCPLYC